MRILLSNDDGYFAPGLAALAEGLAPLGEITVVAPERDRSGASNSLTLDRPLSLRKAHNGFLYVNGTPTDCVTLALNRILPPEELPQICASGINHGGNLGDDATYSGTVAGALEATILGVPGLAFSLVARESFDFSEPARFAITAVRKVLTEGLPEGTLLNINFPRGEIKGVRVTRQGIKNARPVISEHIDPRGKPYFWIGEEYFNKGAAEGTDYQAIEQGCVSVTPLRSDMTDHQALLGLDTWNYVDAAELLKS